MTRNKQFVNYGENAVKCLQLIAFLCYNTDAEKTMFEGFKDPAIENINVLESKLEKQQAQIDRLTKLLFLAQKARFGASSEQAKYVLSDGFEQDTLFNKHNSNCTIISLAS